MGHSEAHLWSTPCMQKDKFYSMNDGDLKEFGGRTVTSFRERNPGGNLKTGSKRQGKMPIVCNYGR